MSVKMVKTPVLQERLQHSITSNVQSPWSVPGTNAGSWKIESFFTST